MLEAKSLELKSFLNRSADCSMKRQILTSWERSTGSSTSDLFFLNKLRNMILLSWWIELCREQSAFSRGSEHTQRGPSGPVGDPARRFPAGILMSSKPAAPELVDENCCQVSWKILFGILLFRFYSVSCELNGENRIVLLFVNGQESYFRYSLKYFVNRGFFFSSISRTW